MRAAFLALVVVVLTACTSGMDPFTLPVSEQWFTLTSQAPLTTCGGSYRHVPGNLSASTFVTCQDGRTGRVEIITRTDGHPVSGQLLLADGRGGAVIFMPILGDRHAYGSIAFRETAPVPAATGTAPAVAPAVHSALPAAAAPDTRPASVSPSSPKPAVQAATGQLFRCTIPVPTIKEQMIKESVDRYPGSCPCPYFSDRAGRSCGKRSAWSRPGGHSPLCYPNDISADMVREFCQVLEMRKARQ